MSGGHFNYAQFKIGDIYESIQHTLDRQGEVDDWGDEYSVFPEDIQEEFKKG